MVKITSVHKSRVSRAESDLNGFGQQKVKVPCPRVSVIVR